MSWSSLSVASYILKTKGKQVSLTQYRNKTVRTAVPSRSLSVFLSILEPILGIVLPQHHHLPQSLTVENALVKTTQVKSFRVKSHISSLTSQLELTRFFQVFLPDPFLTRQPQGTKH